MGPQSKALIIRDFAYWPPDWKYDVCLCSTIRKVSGKDFKPTGKKLEQLYVQLTDKPEGIRLVHRPVDYKRSEWAYKKRAQCNTLMQWCLDV